MGMHRAYNFSVGLNFFQNKVVREGKKKRNRLNLEGWKFSSLLSKDLNLLAFQSWQVVVIEFVVKFN